MLRKEIHEIHGVLHTIETEITARLDNNFKLTIHPVKRTTG